MDLLEQLDVTIDLERSVPRLSVAPRNSSELTLIAEMEKAIVFCSRAFNNADAERLGACFDPEFAPSSPRGELHGQRSGRELLSAVLQPDSARASLDEDE